MKNIQLLLGIFLLGFFSCQHEDINISDESSTANTTPLGLEVMPPPPPLAPNWEANCDSESYEADPNMNLCDYQQGLLDYLAACNFRDTEGYCNVNTFFMDGKTTTTTEFFDLFQIGLGSIWHDYIQENPIPYFPVLCPEICNSGYGGVSVSSMVGSCGGAPILQTIESEVRDELVSTALDFFMEHGEELIEATCAEGTLMPMKIEWTIYKTCGPACCVDSWEDCGDGTYAIVDLDGFTTNSVSHLYPKITFMCCSRN